MHTGSSKGVQSVEDGSEDKEKQRCPICLNVPRHSERVVPDSCSHVYCLGCILRWAQIVQVCPVDRRPFSAVCRQDPSLGHIKIPIKPLATSNTDLCNHQECEAVGSYSGEKKTKIKGKADKKAHGDADSAVLKKRARGGTCRSQLLAQSFQPGLSDQQGETLGILTQTITGAVVSSEEESDEEWRQRCENTVTRHQCLPVSTPATHMTSFLSRPHPHTRALPLHPRFMLSTSPYSPGPGSSGLYGKSCAVTCPKGKGGKSTRGSGSKGSTKQAENHATRRSARTGKRGNSSSAQSQQSDSAPSSPAGSVSNDMPSSAGEERLTGIEKAGTKTKNKKLTRRAVPDTEEEDTEGEQETEQSSEETAAKEELQEHLEADGESNTGASSWQESFDPVDSERDEQEMDTEPLPNPGEGGHCSPFTTKEDEEEEQENVDEPKDNQTSSPEDESCSEDKEASVSSPGGLGKEEENLPSPSCSEPVEGSSDVSSPVTAQPQDDLTVGVLCTSDAITDQKPEPEMEHADSESTNEDGMTPVSGCVSPHHTAENCLQKDEASLVTLESSSCIDNADPVLMNCDSSGSENASLAAEAVTESNNTASETPVSSADYVPNQDEEQERYLLQDEASLETPETKKEESLENCGNKDNTDSVPMDCDSPVSENDCLVAEVLTESKGTAPETSNSSAEVCSQDKEQKSQTQEPKHETSEDQKSSERREGRKHKSRFHSPTSAWSPKRESRGEGSSRRSRSRDRGREHDEERSSSRRNRSRERRSRERRSRERHSRRRSRSHSRSRSRSHSRSRSRPRRRSLSPERNDHGARSPRKRDSWGGDSWRGGRSFRSSNWRSNAARESNSGNGSLHELSPDRGLSENPPWVKERLRGRGNSREREQRSQENPGDAPVDPWARGGWNSERGQGAGQGRGAPWNSGDSADSWQQQRNSYSGTPNNAGGDAYSRFNENRPGSRKRKELDISDTLLDRSGWSSASNWAVRRTLPADVQNYYSRRERGPGSGGGIWSRQEDEQPAPVFSKQPDVLQTEPSANLPNDAVPVLPTVPAPPLLPHQPNLRPALRYPVGPLGPQAPPVSLLPAPFIVPPQIPVHLHPPGAPVQIPSIAVHGLTPPPPPPPPVQQGSLTDSLPQVITSFAVPGKVPLKVAPSKEAPLQAQPISAQTQVAQPSSTTQPPSHSKAHADSSKKEKKLQIQEKAINEVKAAIKPYYQNKDITKEEYKEIVRKSVEKVCHSKSGEVNTEKVANLVKAYVDKYKRARKNKA